MAAVQDDTAQDTARAFERALAGLEAELGVVFTSAERVAAWCDALRHAAGTWTSPSHVAQLRNLFPLLHRRTGAFQEPVFALLHEAARAAAEPWPLLEGLLASRHEPLCLQALDTAADLVARGSLALDEGGVTSLAMLAEREEGPLLSPACLARIGALLAHAADPVTALVVDPGRPAVRRLAARVLDLEGRRPGAALVRRMLGAEAAVALAPVLAYTRAGHLDLVSLVRNPGEPAPIAASLPALVDACGRAVAHDILCELGWRSVNLGLEARRVTGVTVDDSLPFLLTEAEARVVLSCPGARRVFDGAIVMGHGGTPDQAGAGAARDDTVERFRACNLAHAAVLGDLLDIAPLTIERVEAILARMDHLVAEFVGLFAARSEECAALPALYDGLKARIHRAMTAATSGTPLSVELARLVQMFEDPPTLADVHTLHGLKRYLHQRGLALGFGLLESGERTNRTVDLAIVSEGRVHDVVRRIEYMDFDADPARDPGGEPPPYAVAVVVDAFARHLLHEQATEAALRDGRAPAREETDRRARSSSLPRVRIFCYGNEVHYFVTFLNHPVFVRIDYAPPLAGGMIDLAYYGVSKYEMDAHPDLGLDASRALFTRLDFQVEVENTRIHARYDKERALDLGDLCGRAEALFRLVPYLMDADWIIGGLELDAGARRAVAEAWAAFFARWGALPARAVLTTDARGVVQAREPRPEGLLETRWQGGGPYMDVLSGRPHAGWLGSLHDVLSTQGLEIPLVEQEGEAGQITLEQHVLRPLRAALARGALVEAPGGFRTASDAHYRAQHEADRFALLLASNDDDLARAARMARLAGALERSVRFETTGSVNGYEVQRADLLLRDRSAALYALRDGAGIVRLAMFAFGGALCLRRDDARAPWRDSASFDVEAIATVLRRHNLLPAWIDTAPPPENAAALRAIFAAPAARAMPRPVEGELVVAGMSASPGRAVGRARLGTAGRHPADLAGGVLVAATLHPDDSAFLQHASAVVGTGGGILSHAGLMAVQFGRPALVVRATWRSESDGSVSVVYRAVSFDEQERQVGDAVVTERRERHEREARLREGDLVCVDADRGLLHVLGQSGPALALHDGLRSFRDATRRLAAASSPADVLAQRGHRLRALHQLERLLARLTDLPLVQHAVEELMTTPPGTACATARTEQAHLLQVLRDNPVTGALASDCIARAVHQLAGRFRIAADEARRLIPCATSGYAVLVLAGAVSEAHRLLDEVARSPGAARDDERARAAEAAAIEALAAARLSAIATRAVATLREAAARGDMPPTARHLLAQARRIARIVAVPAADRDTLEACEHAQDDRDRAAIAGLASRWVLWPGDGGIELEPLAGSKAANLAELHRLGAAGLVPPWFVVTDRALGDALVSPAPMRPVGPWSAGRVPGTLGDAIDLVLARTDAEPAQQASLIADLWEDARLPPPLVEAIAGAYARLATLARGPGPGDAGPVLGSRILAADRRLRPGVAGMAGAADAPDLDTAPFVAIRSSAREEDTEAATRAGEFDTFLFVRGAEDVVRHLRRAWSGLWTARAIHDRAVGGRAGRGEGGGIIVQAIAWSRVSGVLQTTNLAEGRTREMVVNAGLGLGEGVVAGRVAADHIVISKDEDAEREPLRLRYVIADKRARIVFNARAGSGTVEADVLSHQRLRAALEYAELVELVQAASRLEAAYGYPLDIEFGFDGIGMQILQVRPVPGSLAVWQARGAGGIS